MLMVRVFYVDKKQICCSQNRAELLLACVIVNQDVWCFCLSVCNVLFLSLSTAGSTHWLSMSTYGTLYVNNHL